MKKLLFIPLIVAPLTAAYFVTAQSVQAWTQEECPTPETHPDCLQYFPSPSPTVEPSPVASATATPDTKGDGPTGVTNTEPDRINSPTASNGAGIGGAAK